MVYQLAGDFAEMRYIAVVPRTVNINTSFAPRDLLRDCHRYSVRRCGMTGRDLKSIASSQGTMPDVVEVTLAL